VLASPLLSKQQVKKRKITNKLKRKIDKVIFSLALMFIAVGWMLFFFEIAVYSFIVSCMAITPR
jgi:hypothetical protein